MSAPSDRVDARIASTLESAGPPALHPGGRSVVYAHGRPTAEGRASRLRQIDLDGTARWLTDGPRDRSPSWSPGGDALVFLRAERDGPAQPWWLNPTTGEERRLCALPNGVLTLTYTPDGRQLLAVANVVEPSDGPGRVVRRLQYRHDDVGWTGDRRRHLFSIDLDDGRYRQLTEGDYDHAFPVASPDGTRVAFTSDRSEDRWLRDPDGSELCWMDLAEGTVHRLVTDVFGVSSLAWSADGEQLVFVATEPGLRWQSYLGRVELATGRHERLTADDLLPQTGFFPVIPPPTPVVRADGVLFLADVRSSSSVWLAGDGEGPSRVRAEEEWILAWSPDREGRRVALLTTTFDRPAEVTWLDTATGESRRLTDASGPYLSGRSTATVRRREVRSDPYAIDTWVIRPPGFDPARRHPLVLDVHGGPNSFFPTAFSPLHQILAAHGFVVVLANPRGSTSYGPEFTAAVFEDWGGGDYRDLMAVLDEVCAEPWVDEDRVGVHGYSYGGYMAAWMVGHTRRFRAAVIGAPISNLVSFYGGTDIAASFAEVQFGGTPAEAFDAYVERSPLTYARRVDTPVLLLHGEDDLRCPVGQSEELYLALRRAGKTVEMVRYPDTSHMLRFTGRPAVQKDYYERTRSWLERWLG